MTSNYRAVIWGLFVLTFITGITLSPTTSFADHRFRHIRNNPDGTQTLRGHIPQEIGRGKAKFRSHASRTIEANIVLPLRNSDQLDQMIKDVSDPSSPRFRQFLSPDQFNKQFGPSPADIQKVQNFLAKKGIVPGAASANGFVLNVRGAAASFEKAFGLRINDYANPDGKTYYAPDADPTIPAEVAGMIVAVGGLDNMAKMEPLSRRHDGKPSGRASQSTQPATAPLLMSPAGNTVPVPAENVGSGPNGYLSPKDIKTAYNMNGIPATGAGQTLALIEFDGYLKSDIQVYNAYFGLPGVPLENILIDGFNGVPDFTAGAPEVTLDIQLMMAFAPRASKILVYEAPNTLISWMNAWTKIATDNRAKIISCSWGISELETPTIAFDNQIFAQMAAQGQAVFTASGDWGGYLTQFELDHGLRSAFADPFEPAVQPYVTAVGITKFDGFKPDGTYQAEWGDGQSGGGVSFLQSLPEYQMPLINGTSGLSSAHRNVPDVALSASWTGTHSFFIQGEWQGYWGSSLSAPIWASFMAMVNEGLGVNGPLGFANPALYRIAQSGRYLMDFHDITGGNNFLWSNAPGLDLVTGLGSFNGLNLYNDLINQYNNLPLSPTALVANFSVSTGQVALSWKGSLGALSYLVKRATIAGGPYTDVSGSVSGLTWTDRPAITGGTYYYVVSAVNKKGGSSNSNEVSVKAIPPGSIPAQPQIRGTAGYGQVSLTWPTVSGAASYNVKRAVVSGGPYAVVANVQANTYIDTGLANGKAYFYIVSAVNQKGEGINSTEISVFPLTPPASTASGNVSASMSDNYVLLLWTPVTGATGYHIKRSTTKGGPYALVGDCPRNSCLDLSPALGTTYYYVITAQLPEGEGAASIEAKVSTPAVPTALPAAPTGLLINGLDGTSVTLTWNAVGGASTYTVKRAMASGGPYVAVATVNAGYTSYMDQDVKGGTTYYYVVSATNAKGEGPNCIPVSATPDVFTPPFTPGHSIVPGNGQILFIWYPLSSKVLYYNVKRSTSLTGPYVTVAKVVGANSYLDKPLTNGTTYYYLVTAVNEAGEGDDSRLFGFPPLSATPFASALSAPTNLRALSGYNQVNLYWDSSGGTTIIKRSTVDGGPYTVIGTDDGGQFVDTSAAAGSTYYYVVSVTDGKGNESPNSAQIQATPVPSPAPLVLTAVGQDSAVQLRWQAPIPPVGTGVARYEIMKSLSPAGPFLLVGQPGYGQGDSFTDYAVSNGAVYYYTIHVVYRDISSQVEIGKTDDSPVIGVVPVVPKLPDVPSGLVVGDSGQGAAIRWEPSQNAAYYLVKRSTTSDGPFMTIQKCLDSYCLDKFEADGATYYYVVSAVNSVGESMNSAPVGFTAPPASPTPLKATAGNDVVFLTWNSSPRVMYYKIYRTEGTYGPTVNFWTGPSRTYTDASAIGGKTYSYLVEAINAGGSAYSNDIKISPARGISSIPVGIMTGTGDGTATLSWAPVGGASGYKIKRATVPGGPYTVVATPPATTYTDAALVNAVTYYYVISAVVSGNEGPNSVEVSITPSKPVPPLQPRLHVTAMPGGPNVLTWEETPGALSYKVKRSSVSGGPYSVIANTSMLMYADYLVMVDVPYFYVVSTVWSGGESADSAEVRGMVASPPDMPTGFKAIAGYGNVQLSWNAVPKATQYEILRATGKSKAYSEYFYVTGNTFIDTKVSNGTTYFYALVAINGGGGSAVTQEVSATPIADQAVPSTPTRLTARGISSSRVDLAWTPSSDNVGVVGYKIYRNGTQVTTSSMASYTDYAVTGGTAYTYTVSAYDSAGYNSGQSEAGRVTPPLADLNPGFKLTSGGSPLVLRDGSKLVLGTDGNLILSSASGAKLWDTATLQTCTGTGCMAYFQGDGNFVLSNNGVSYWQSRTASMGKRLEISNAVPYVQIYDSNNQVVFGSSYYGPVSFAANKLLLAPNTNQAVVIHNAMGQVTGKLAMQQDGSLVMYEALGGAWVSKWSTMSGGRLCPMASPYCYAYFQGDGNFVVSDGTNSLWQSRTSGNNDAVLVISDKEPYLTITKGAGGAVLWTTADKTPPNAPVGLTATAASTTQVNLTWNTATDNYGTIGYRVFRNGVYVGSTNKLTYSDTGLTTKTAYTYTISAFDAAGNISALSAPKAVTTL